MKGYAKDQARIADLTRRYGGQISASTRGRAAVDAAALVLRLMEEWNPIHATVADLKAIMGEPTVERPGVLEYVFDHGYSGHSWRFAVADDIVVGTEWNSLD
jgi:transposase